MRKIIWSNIFKEDDYKEAYEEEISENSHSEEYSIYDFINDEIECWFDAESWNMNVECGDILCICDLGFWNGRASGYKIIKNGKVNGIFKIPIVDLVEFYCEDGEVKCTINHHDGTHYITFREIRPNVNIQKICDKLYYNEDITPRELGAYTTKNLYRKIAKVYGW